MAGTLIFPVNVDLLRIIRHSKDTPCRKPYTNEPAEAGLLLVKDDGVYLMSAAKTPLRREEGSESSLVVYAEGHDPRDGDCWEDDRQVCGGDDFGEFLTISDFERNGPIVMGRKLIVKLTKTTMQIGMR